MDCHSVERALLEGAPLPSPAREHLARCPACATLAEDGGDLARALSSEADAELVGADRAILDAVAGDNGPLAWLASRPTWIRVTLALAAAAAMVAATRAVAPRWDLDVYPGGRMAAVLVALGAAGVLLARWSLRPLQRPPPSWAAWAVALGAGFALPVVLAALPSARPATALTDEAALRAAASCFFTGALLAVPVVALVRRLDRRRGPPGARAVLGAAGLGGLVANLALQVHCPIPDPVHLLSGHAPISLGLALALGAGAAGWRRLTGRGVPRRGRFG